MAFSPEYDTVARAIRFLHSDFKRQPSLEEIAGHVGLSPFHFQRLFSRWAGVSPKRFLQFLTVEYAKTRLQESSPVLQAAFDAGLSGPARLHDLLVTTEGVTPGEFKAKGQTLSISFGIADTPFGPALLGNTPRGLCHLAFLESHDPDGSAAFSHLTDSWPDATFIHESGQAKALASRIFSSVPKTEAPRALSLFLQGTNFQIRVWTALLRIGPGHVSTYGRLAGHIGKPGASRALGSALGRNPVGFLIPCHRVIRESGQRGGYRWGPERKEAILGWEAARLVS